ncbi:MAG: hypothetical protein AAF846_10205 [Chloroflexota bacterium]
MANLPVREMVLYKHGVGFFVRQGAVEGEHIALTFRKDEINDVLKSLAVFDQAGGQVLGIHYQTPMDKATRLASSSIKLSQKQSLRDLLRDLRGRECELVFEVTAGTQETVNGRIIGIDEVETEEDFSANVSVLTEHGVRVFPYETLRSFKIADEQSSHDLSYFLDTSMAEDDRRVVSVRLTEGEHDLAVYYVAPSPTWRVSYRLVAERDEDGSTGKALLQGWGLFDNRLEEDLNNVRVTLVAGQPISFIYDLYASKIPQRPTVEDKSRVAPGPIEYASAQSDAVMDFMEAEHDVPSFLRRALPREEAKLGSVRPTISQAQAAAPAQAESKDSGETFQYIVTTPVTVKRGESALVPIIGYEVNYERELLYNQDKLPNHPVASLRFDNNSGLTLERGPVTLVEDGDYKGEAVIPFTKDNQQVYVPYAVELGVVVTERTRTNNITSGLSIHDKALWEQTYNIRHTTYTIENNTTNEQFITIEASILHNYELYETRQPDTETANERRWQVRVDAQEQTEFVRTERYLQSNRVNVRHLNHNRLYEYLKQNWLDKQTFDYLSDILRLVENSRQNQKLIQDNEREKEKIYRQQEQIRANLGALQPTGQEATLRNRLLNQLESTQDRLDAIENEINEAKSAIEHDEKQVETLINDL